MPRRPRRNPDAELVRRATRRLAMQTVIGAAIVVAILVGVTTAVLVRDQSAAADVLLADTVARADDVDDPPAGTWLVIRTTAGTAQTDGLPAGLPDTTALDRVAAGGPVEAGDLSLDGRDFRVRTELRQVPGNGMAVVQAVLDLSIDHAQLLSVLRALLIGGIVGLALAAAAGSWLGRRAVRPLQTALGLQRRFVADAGHELRTPLTLLSTRAQLLRRRARSGAAAEALRGDLDGVVDDARRLAEILDDLLLAADPLATQPDEPVDLEWLADGVLASAAPAARLAGVRLTRVGPPAPAWVRGAAAGLRRALVALVDNAVRHATAEVTVAVTPSNASVIVEVTDDGPGIDAQMLPRLFQRFASDTARDEVGPRRYGLGLALVNDIIYRHEGTVSAANRDGGGAVFRIVLPAVLDGTGPPRNL
jgi:two-component system, OmpR family, sensor kinase